MLGMRTIEYSPIGIVHSPLRRAAGAPIQSASAKHVEGTVEVFPPFVAGLKDIAGFSHLILLYHFHLSRETALLVKPYLDIKEHGIFATRAPNRPNPIGISVVKLKKVRGRVMWVQDLDVIDGTPLLDIKPYVPKFDVRRAVSIGWLKSRIGKLNRTRADERFSRRDDRE